MIYFITMLILLLLIIVEFILFNKDVLSPSLLFACSMFMCVLCSIIGLVTWNDVKDIKVLTAIIIIIQVISFGAGELFIRKVVIKDKGTSNFKVYNDVEWWKIIAQAIFVIITIVLLFGEVKRIAIIAGYTTGGLGTIIGKFRELSILYTTELLDDGQGINLIVSQMRKICEVICFVNIFFIINNIYKGKIKNVKNIGYITIIILCFVLSLLTAGRMQILIYIISGMFMIMVLYLSKHTLREFLTKYLKYFLILGILTVVGFYIILPLSGRKNDVNFVDYMSFYIGTSVPSLDKYLDMEVEKPQFFGEESLRGIQTVLYKLGCSDYIQPISKEWLEFKVNDEQYLYSNIFTAGKRYYHDFGIIGVIICQFIFGCIFAYIYMIMNKKSNTFLLIFLAMNIYMVMDQIRDEQFFANFIHINTIIYGVVLYIGFKILTTLKIKGRKNEDRELV